MCRSLLQTLADHHNGSRAYETDGVCHCSDRLVLRTHSKPSPKTRNRRRRRRTNSEKCTNSSRSEWLPKNTENPQEKSGCGMLRQIAPQPSNSNHLHACSCVGAAGDSTSKKCRSVKAGRRDGSQLDPPAWSHQVTKPESSRKDGPPHLLLQMCSLRRPLPKAEPLVKARSQVGPRNFLDCFSTRTREAQARFQASLKQTIPTSSGHSLGHLQAPIGARLGSSVLSLSQANQSQSRDAASSGQVTWTKYQISN